MKFKLQDSQTGCQIYLADNGLGYRQLDNKTYLGFYFNKDNTERPFIPIGAYKRYQNCIRHLKEWAKENGI